MNKITEWIKSHPAISASVAGGVALILYLMARSSSTGSSSDVAAVANSQTQQATLANQNAAVQAQAQVQETQSELAAQASNNQTAAQLAAIVEQTQASENTANQAATVANTQTAAQENVADTTINAELAAQQSQVTAEENGLTTEFSYLTQANNNQTALAMPVVNAIAPNLYNQSNAFNAAALTSDLAEALNEPSIGTESASQIAPSYASQEAGQAAIIQSVTNGISTAFSSLFA